VTVRCPQALSLVIGSSPIFGAHPVASLRPVLSRRASSCVRVALRRSRWIADVFHDQDLADRIGSAEREIKPDSAAAVVESGRLAIMAALQPRRSQRLTDPVRRDPSTGDVPRWRGH
jgi:hypothetical protein